MEVRQLADSFPGRATLEAVLDTAARAPSLKNLQPWRWHVDATGIHLIADWSRRTGDGGPNDRRDVLLGCGAVLDHCAVALAASGWRPRVHRFPDPADDSHLAILEVIDQPPRAADRELAAAIRHRRSDRRRFSPEALPAGTLELLQVRAARRGVAFGVVPRRRWAHSDDGSVVLEYDGALDTHEHADASAVLVLGTDRDDDRRRLLTGETLSHLLLTATGLGLATCTLTEPLNNVQSRLAMACEVFDGAALPQALIRVGVPASDTPVPALERRSVDETTTWSVNSDR